MSYTVKDKSVHDGAPIECYEFVATHKTWRYTSYHSEITVAGHLYTPLAITRTALEIGSVIDSVTTMDFNIPASTELAKTFCFTVSPVKLDVTVYRVHEGDDYSTDYKIEYIGEIAGAGANEAWGTIKTASKLQTQLNGNLSSVYYQKICNHELYDERCKADRNAHTESAVVTKVQGQLITVNDMVFPVSDLVGGEIKNLRTGEVQRIITNALDKIKIGYPFFDIIVGDAVELTQGCDHMRLGHCKNRFNNVPNYGGFDFIPEVNPFAELQYSTTTSTTTSVRTDQALRLFWKNEASY